MSRTLVYPGLIALGLAAPLAAQKPVIVEASVKIADIGNREAMPPVAPLSEQTTLSKLTPKGGGVPTGLTDPWFGEYKLGAKTIQVVVAKTDADLELPDLLCIDLNADGTIGDDEKLVIDVQKRESRGTEYLVAEPVDAEIAVGDKTIPVKIRFMKVGDREPSVALQFPNYLSATVKIDGADRVIAILDKDYDATFGSDGDMWALAEVGGRPANAYGLSAMKERRFEKGQLVGIEVDGDAIVVKTEPADGPDPADAAAHRKRVEHLWTERFDEERDDFVSAREMDTTRPITDKPIDWHYVTFDEALSLAKQEDKPLFVDVMAFWCVWCYRMDYYTYPDAEVAKVLEEDFIPVKIIQEQDYAGDYDMLMKDKLEARGIPAMGVFNADGDVVHKISGWKKPEDFLKELQDAKEKLGG